jgi:CheY-like chemotaxis protein
MTHLLIIDDEQDLLDALAAILSDVGYQVEAVSSAKTALEILHSSDKSVPDLIIADVVMPDMTGVQLFEVVRSSPELCGIPFLFVSAFVSPEIKALVAEQKGADVLGKPFEVEELLQAIEETRGLVSQ